MITNELQYKITNSQLSKLRAAIEEFDIDKVSEKVGSKILAKAEFDSIKSEIEELEKQINEYESLEI